MKDKNLLRANNINVLPQLQPILTHILHVVERGEKERERETPRAKRIMVLGGKNE